MAARNRDDLKTFVSNNGSDRETFRISRSDDSRFVMPIEAISDGDSTYASTPYGRYTASEVTTMWGEMLKQLNFEEKLKSFYESLMSGLEERHKSTQEKMEQQDCLMKALMCEVCDKISACFAPPQTSGQPTLSATSAAPTPRATSSFRLSRTPRLPPQPRIGSQQLHEDSGERTCTPNVILTSPDGEITASDFQVDGESTYAIFVSRNDHERVINMLSRDEISYLVESIQSTSDDNIRMVRSENRQRLFPIEVTNINLDDADHRHSAATIKGHRDHLIDHDVQGSEEEVRVKPGFWNNISDRKGDAEMMMVTVKEMQMVQQQQQQLKHENAELKVVIEEKDRLLKEKERTIQILESVHAKIDATTGGLMQIMQNEQGHVSGMIAHCGDLTKRLPIEVSVTKKMEAVGSTRAVQPHPQPPEEKEEKYSAQETEANLHNMENNNSPTLEAVKTARKTFEKPPRKEKSDGKLTNKKEAKSPTAKGSLKSVKSTKFDDEPVKGSTDPVEKPVDDKSDKPDVEDDTKPHNLSSQLTICDALPKNKSKSDDHIDDSKLSTPV